MNNILLNKTTNSDLAGVYVEVAEQIGIDNAYLLFEHFRGQQLTFPLNFYSSDYIARETLINLSLFL